MDFIVNAPIKIIFCYVLFAVILRGFCQSTNNDRNILFIKESGDIIWNSDENAGADDSFTIKTEGCNIPGMHFLDPSIRNYVYYPKNVLECPNSEYPLVRSNQTHLWIIKENLRYYYVYDKNKFRCFYKYFQPLMTRTNRGVLKPKDSGVKYLSCENFTDVLQVKHEYVRVICEYEDQENSTIYDQFFAFTPKKRFTEHRMNPFEFPTDQSTYNVLIMGLSSVSRLNFHRTMPNTLNLLKKKGVIEMLGYSKIVDEISNMVPMLIGMTYKQLKNTCWTNPSEKFDRCPFIWERFKDIGYYTAFVEDAARFGTFNLNHFGMSAFDYIPTDYYLQPFIRESSRQNNISSTMCMGDKYYFKVMLDYIESLTSTLKSNKLFGLFWESSLSYKHLNYPMLMDHSYEALINKLDSTGYLNDTILILLSDHGIKFGNIRLTTQGRLEERLPFLYILLPPSFRDRYSLAYENVKRNSLYLTTPLDLHATLIDLIDLNAIRNEELLARTRRSYAIGNDISLFLPIPSNRTCGSAGINLKLCTCLKSKRIPVNSLIAHQASVHLLRYLNKFLTPYPQCTRLMTDHIIEAMEMTNTYENSTGWRDFMVIVRTKPGDGLFEAILRRNERNNNKWLMSGTVSRLNHYDEHSRCVQDYQLKLYCFCR